MSRIPAARAATLVVAALVTVAGCTVVAPDDGPGPTSSATAVPSPTPSPATAETRLPDEPVSVLPVDDAAGRALAVTRTLWSSAPVAVVAPAADPTATTRAASVAVALGAPLLLADDGAPGTGAAADDDGADPTARVTDELARLEVDTVLTVGEVPDVAPDEATTVRAPDSDDDLGDLLGRDLTSTPFEGDPVAAVTGLERGGAVVLSLAEDAATTDAEQASVPTAGGDDATPSSDATPSPDALPETRLAPPLDDGVLLVLGGDDDVAAVASARAAGVDVHVVGAPDPRATAADVDALAESGWSTTVALGTAFGSAEDLAWRVETAATGTHLPGGGQVLFPGRRMVALYGTPGVRGLGVLGEQDLDASVERAQKLARHYRPLTDETVVPAFEMIVTVASASAGDDGDYSRELPVETFRPWVDAAREAGVYVILDLQPGRTDFLTQAKRYEELLLEPHVGLALDPEWRLEPDEVHLEQIGSVDAAEVNEVSTWLADLTREHALPQKLLVLHQFSLRMITNRDQVDTSRPELAVMIHADGQGSQPAKAGTWEALHRNAPEGLVWGWKNFNDEDSPMLTPEQTYQVRPLPELVTYQ